MAPDAEQCAIAFRLPSLKYSIFSLARNALRHHENWPLAWRSPTPKKH